MRLVLLLSPILLASLLGCGSQAISREDEEPAAPEPVVSAAEVVPAVEASNAFAVDLFKKLGETKPKENLAFSPYSISSALAMALEGARGKTAEEMGQTMRLPESLRLPSTERPWNTPPYGSGLKAIGDRLMANPKMSAVDRVRLAKLRTELAELNSKAGKVSAPPEASELADKINKLDGRFDRFDVKVANAFWGDKEYPFDDRYLAEVDRIFGAGRLRLADLRNNYPAERLVINRWVEEQTNDRIKELLPDLPENEWRALRLILVNAIWFKGNWSQPFDERATTDGDFHLPGGDKKTAKLMHHNFEQAKFAAFDRHGDQTEEHKADTGFSMLELPIKGDRLAMTFLAPHRPDGLPEIESMLTGPALERWIAALQRQKVHVTLPRFKVEGDFSLGDTLQQMGMRRAFSTAADFSAMTKNGARDLFIGYVFHKAFVEVNEKGAEAAAATAVLMRDKSASRIAEFRADRPFLFLIRDTDSGMILFMGRVSRPG